LNTLEIRWHGRGGQGAVTAGEVLASAAIIEGKYALAFPEFGAERRGAPVRAYTRVTNNPNIPRTPIEKPDVVVILDKSLLKHEYIEGLKPGGYFIANTPLMPNELMKKLNLPNNFNVSTVDATSIALKWLKANIVNTAILGAVIKTTNLLKIETIINVIKSRFPGKIGEANASAVQEAYENTIVMKLQEAV
jgi:ketoisovalerate ferredoxin oxidoreductase, gamma subunit (EC 1.2.7.7)/pyruvate ferredoxin oxidoreductase, gamma subunit (EC 1.2.7.1)